MTSLIIGIDDAGRGPLIGSMFLAGVLLTSKQEQQLKEEGVADSKTLTDKRRFQLAGVIKDTCQAYHIEESLPKEIDHAVEKGGINLNTLEAMKAATIINKLAQGTQASIQVVVDCPSVNTNAWKAILLQYIKKPDQLEVSCEHKADANHPSVSAASILAKCAREESITKLKKEYGDFGSGYPSDPTTKAYLLKYGAKYASSGLFRRSWATWKAIYHEKEQQTLS